MNTRKLYRVPYILIIGNKRYRFRIVSKMSPKKINQTYENSYT